MGKVIEIEAARIKRAPAHVQRAMLIRDLINVAECLLRAEEEAFGDPDQVEHLATKRREALGMARKIAVEIADEN